MVNANTSLVAMYIIGKTESNNTWDSVNYNDPITIGMMQWYGTRAAGLLNMLPQHWSALAPSIRSNLETYEPNNSSFWTNKFLNETEGESIRAVLRSDDGKAAQQTLWESDYADNVSILGQYGFSEDRPQPLILLMSALHQSPKRAHTIARNYGGASSLLRIYQAIRNERVLSQYMTHRYTPTYNYLNGWNGTDAPPEFGQVRGDYTPPGDDQNPPVDDNPGGPDDPATGIGITYISQQGDQLHVHMADGTTAVAHPQSIQTWTGVGGGAIVPDPPTPEPPDTDDPPAPEPGEGWYHPCPARSRVSSEWGPRGGGMHRGIDFAAPMGTPLYAVDAGTVLRAGTATGFGGYVGIRLDTGEAVGYGHMKPSSALVSTGDRVTKGQQISAVASEGQSTGPHLHFEVYSGGTLFAGHVNPRPYLEARGVTP